ncbi:MAG: hypothetical protein AVO33_00165 [delta proteobacterium ML8_F1]|nr:MAG: hypothetical protein AVO33_00165 [delta proteobacterium ML8_F1]
MEKIGYVIGEKDGRIVLDVKRTGSCGDKCKTCQSHCEVPSVQVTLDNHLQAKIGDFVEVGMQPASLIKTTFVIYTIPLVMFILALSLGVTVFKNAGMTHYEGLALLTGFAVLGLTFVVLHWLHGRSGKEKPSILEMKKIL